MSAEAVARPSPGERVTAPPLPAAWGIAAALGSAVCAGLASFWWPISVLGYGLGALVTPIAAIAFRFGKQKVASSPYFVLRKSLEQRVIVALAIGVSAALVNAWFLATELAKR